MLIAWLLIALAGLAIGATSIGGVLVVPALHRWMGLEIADAMALSSQAFLWTGLWALWRLPRLGMDLLRRDGVLLLMALFGAVLGVWLSTQVPAPWIRSWIGALALLSDGQDGRNLARLRMELASMQLRSQSVSCICLILVGLTVSL